MPFSAKLTRPALAALGIALACPIASDRPATGAQVQVQLGPQQVGGNAVNPENFEGKEMTEGVYVPESEGAMEKLATAQKMERLKEWNKSADLYQEVLNDPKYHAKVVPSKEDAEHRVYQYSSVEDLVMQRLAKWPEQGLEVYRARYEADASSVLDAAGADDLTALHQVFSRYFVTNSGKSAGMRLMDRALDDGEFRAAAAIGDRLLQWHPNLIAERGAVLFRTAMAYHLAGEDPIAAQRFDELKKHNPQDKGVVRGKEVILADALEDELKTRAPESVALASDSYRTFGGDFSRDLVPAASSAPGAHLYSVSLSKPSWSSVPQAQALEARYKEDAKNGNLLGVVPAVDRGELFFQDGQRVYGVSLESGVPLPGWSQSHGADHSGAYTLPNTSGSPRNSQLTLTLTERCVLAVLGQSDPRLLQVGIPPQGETRLVCLDRATGREAWVAAPSQLPQDSLKGLQFGGSPLVAGDNVLVVGNASKQAGFEDCYVLCYQLGTGKMRWACHVATASTVSQQVWGFNPNLSVPNNPSHLAYANGRVYVQTNRGAVAAVDAYSGTIAWLDIYHRGQQVMNPAFNPMFNGGQFSQNQVKPWAFNPVMVSGGMVFTLPLEGKAVFVYDAATGEPVKKIDLDDLSSRLRGEDTPEREDFDTLVGVVGEKLVLAGSHTLVMLNWKTYDGEHFRDDMLFWIESVFNSVRGRPFLTATSVYVPDSDKLNRVDLRTGMVKETYPKYPRTWDEGEGPGNVLVSSDHVVVAGAERVDVYTDLEAAKAKLDRELAAAPADPQPRLRYAEVMFAAGDYDTSIAKLDEAIDRLGGAANMAAGPNRDRVFNDALTFAQKLRTDERPEVRERTDKLFDRAASAASSPDQQVHYRVARARFEASRKGYAAAVKLYQQILADAAMRSVSIPDESGKSPDSADMVAEKAIDALARLDPSAYESYAKDAAAALEQAEASKDPGKLLAVAQIYPNSESAFKGMLGAASAYEFAGDLRNARRVLLDIYQNHASRISNWPQILEALARTDLQVADRAGGARKLLAIGVEKYHDPKLAAALKLPDGSEVPVGTAFSAALDKVRKLSWQAQARMLPTLSLPIPQNGHRNPKPFKPEPPVIHQVDALVVPVTEFARADRLVTWSSGPTLAIYKAGETQPLATSAHVPEKPVNSAWLDKSLLVWGPTRLDCLSGDSGDSEWSLDLSRLQTLEVITAGDAADAPPPVANANQPNGVLINPQGQVFMRNGLIVRQQVVAAPAAANAPKPAAGPEHVVQVLPLDERVLVATSTGRVLAVGRADGKVIWQTRLADHAMDRLVADQDFTVLKVTDDAAVRLVVLDTFSGHVRGIKTYPTQMGLAPQNVALASDGTLVYTLPDRICIKDLYKPWGDAAVERPAPPGQATFNQMARPDQLIVSEGRILALTDTGNGDRAGEKFVRLYSLETGEPIMLNFDGGQQVERALSAGTKSFEAGMRLVGPRLYVIAPDAAECYNLEHPDDHYEVYGEQWQLSTIYNAFLGSDFLVFLGEDPDATPEANPAPAPQPGAVAAPNPENVLRPAYEFYAFGRYQTPRGESGRLDYQQKITDPAGITTQWQAFDGGVCYLTADKNLHLLLGAK